MVGGMSLIGRILDDAAPTVLAVKQIATGAPGSPLLAADIIANYPDPEKEAFARHERAWYDSDGAEQTYWHRVRKAVRRRREGR